MPETIISASGVQHGLIITPEGAIVISGLVTAEISGGIHIGSVSANVDSIYVQSGDNINLGTTWTGVGSVVISGTLSTTPGSESVITAGSVEVYQNTATDLDVNIGNIGSVRVEWGVGSVQFTGSTEVFQTTASDMLVDIGNIGSVRSLTGIGSVRIAEQGVDIDTLLGSTSIYNRVAGSIVNMPDINVAAGSTRITGIAAGSLEVFQTTNSDLQVQATQEGDWNIAAGSMRIFGVSGGTSMPLLVTSGTEAILRVDINTDPVSVSGNNLAGSFSIVNVPEVNIANTGSVRSLTGIGSVRIAQQGIDLDVLLGSTAIHGDVDVLLGSVALHGVGSIVNLGSVEVFQTTATDLTVDIGNIGSVRTLGGIGSVRLAAQGVDIDVLLGSTAIHGDVDVLLGSTALHGVGSMVNLGSVEVFQTTAGDMTVDIGNIGSVRTLGGIGSVVVSGTILPRGNAANQIIRKDSGSPAVDYVFSAVTEAFMIDNLGSSPIYFALDASANPANSGTGFIADESFRSFDGQVGSVSIQGSGLTSPSVQVIRLT